MELTSGSELRFRWDLSELFSGILFNPRYTFPEQHQGVDHLGCKTRIG